MLYKYRMEMMVIDRHVQYNNSDIHDHIQSIHKDIIGDFSTPIPIQIGEVIRFKDNKDYVVDKIIRDYNSNIITLQVSIFRTKQGHSCGSNYWAEEIPLILDIEIKEDKR